MNQTTFHRKSIGWNFRFITMTDDDDDDDHVDFYGKTVEFIDFVFFFVS